MTRAVRRADFPGNDGQWRASVEERLRRLFTVAGTGPHEPAGVVTLREILTDPTGPQRFENTDTGIAFGPGNDILIPLSYVPKPGSEQVFYAGLPLQRSDWSRTDGMLTIPAEPWFVAGKPAWVTYAHDGTSAPVIPAAYDSVSSVSGDHTSLPLPGVSTRNDMLVLALIAGTSVGCADPRFIPKITQPAAGVWIGLDDGSGAPIAIAMDSAATSGGVDSVAAVMRITGAPLLPPTSEQTSTGSGASFSPTMPPSGSLGAVAIFSGVGLVSSSLNGDTLGNWTERARIRGGGSGRTSVYLGTAPGLPPGEWTQFGTDPGYGAWVGGLQ